MINQRKAGFVLSYVQMAVNSIVGILYTPFMISSLGDVEYGLYQLILSTIGYLALLDFGLGGTLTRFILKYKTENDSEKVKSVISICVKIYFVLALAGVILTFVLAYYLQDIFPATINGANLQRARQMFILMGISSAISFFGNAYKGIINAHERYTVNKGVALLKVLLRVSLIFFLLWIGCNALAIVLVDFVLCICIVLFDAVYSYKALDIRIFAGAWDSGLFKGLTTFSIFVFLQIIITQINNSLDRMLLGRYTTLEMVSLYAVVMQLYNLFNSCGGVIPSITLPQISRCVFRGNDDKTITGVCAQYSRYQFLVLMPIFGGFLLFGQKFIHLWLHGRYDVLQVWLIAVMIIAPNILEFIESPIFHVMKAKNMQATRSLLLFIVTIMNLILSIILVKSIPIYGTAIGTAVSFMIGNNILSNIYYHKKVGIMIPLYFKKTFSRLLPTWGLSCVLGAALLLIPGTSWLTLVVQCGGYLFLYAGLTYFLGMNQSEKKMVTDLITKMRVRKTVN